MTVNTMYQEAKGKTWSPFVGCYHDCIYCGASFQRQMKRQRKRCQLCYDYTPHFHAHRLQTSLPRTSGQEFIFCCDYGDIAFASLRELSAIMNRIQQVPDRTILLQSKNPSVFHLVMDLYPQFPANLMLGTTMETNRDDEYRSFQVSKAPPPSQRYLAMRNLNIPRKTVTVEPILDFDLDVFVYMLSRIKPETVYVGYENHGVTKKRQLPEPPLAKTEAFIEALEAFTIVRRKTIRKAWSEEVNT